MSNNKALRILYIHQHFATKEGPSSTRSFEFSKYLLSKGHRVTMVCGVSGLDLSHVPRSGRLIERFVATEHEQKVRLDVSNGVYIYTYKNEKEKGTGKFTIIR